MRTTGMRVGGLVPAFCVVLLAVWGCGGAENTQGGTAIGRGDSGGSGGSNTGTGGTRGSGSGGGSAGSSNTGGSGTAGSGAAGAGGAGGDNGGTPIDAAVSADASDDDAGAAVDARPVLSKSPVPAPWMGEDIGKVGMAGGSGRTRHEFEVRGSGTDVFGAADAFQYLHRPVTGDVEIVGRLTGIEHTSGDAKAGLMFRETSAPDSRNVFMLALPVTAAANGMLSGKGTRLQYRDNRTDNLTGFFDLVSLQPGVPDGAPVWLRLTRKGALFEGFISADGLAWKKDGEITMMLPPEISAGLAVTSHANSDANLATFESVRITALTDPTWAHDELGTLGGSATGGPRRFELSNAGRGIANGEDGVTFVHQVQQHLGDIELTGRVTALSYAGTKPARIGLMLRGAMGADARMVAFVLELGPNGQRLRLQRRSQDAGNVSTTEDMTAVVMPDAGAADPTPPAAMPDGGSDGGAAPVVELHPVWIKLVRVGQRFVGFVSEDGRRWRAVIDLPGFVVASNAFVGVTLTSGTESEMVSGRIENVTIAAPTTALPEHPDAGSDASDASGDDAP